MFTGIVAELGEVAGVDHHGDAARLTIRGSVEGVALGESIAVNGVCLTVTGILGGTFTADVMGETLSRSGLGALGPGAPVNLERSVRLADRLGGHLVSDHVDGLGTVHRFEPIGESFELVIDAPRELAKFLAFKGSVVVNGVSLTVNTVSDGAEGTEFTVNLIPHTQAVTTLGAIEVGQAVNIEIDVLARYLSRMRSLLEK